VKNPPAHPAERASMCASFVIKWHLLSFRLWLCFFST
jgi:hypothetical protein